MVLLFVRDNNAIFILSLLFIYDLRISDEVKILIMCTSQELTLGIRKVYLF